MPLILSRRFASGYKRWPVLVKTESAKAVCSARRGTRTPEVVIKVVSAGSNTVEAVRQHFADLQDGKHRALEMDFFATPIMGKKEARTLIEDWDLDLDALLWRQPYIMPTRRTPPKLVHKLIFSMPAGTPPDKLVAAVRRFAQEEFEPEHRYALALHTDEPHPHVHVVVRAARSRELTRLNIRKPLLRKWRRAFARHLRAEGIAAKATQRKVREQRRASTLIGMSRPIRRRPALVP